MKAATMPLSRLPSLSSLRAFEAAARRGSFKAAASELHVTAGAVSQQIKGLEADLGVILFTRKIRAVHLTPHGQALQPVLSDAFLAIRQAVDAIRPGKTPPRLRINSSGPIIGKWLLPRLHRFTEFRPDIFVNIETEGGVNAMTEGGPDIVIRYAHTAPNDLYSIKLHTELLIPVASPQLLAARGIRSPDDLHKAPILHVANPMRMRQRPAWARWSDVAGLADQSTRQDSVMFEPLAADQVVDAAASGVGIALAQSLLAHGALSDGRLTCPFGPVIPSGQSYYLCCRPGRETAPDVAAFFDWAMHEAAVLTTLNALHSGS
ncbi:LysR substrate-binding domain-containing protein [Roseibium sp.]|uniref:LysR substrate-binding domain-containing protein n=1 Tax=Roseibium sp. TaxID=1936156 RepID=UPI003B507DDD